MKKALAVLLSVLVIFSMLGVVACATEDEPDTSALVTVMFLDDEDKVIKVAYYAPGTVLGSDNFPDNLEKADTETERYIFKGWRCENDGEMYYKNKPYTISVNAQAGDVVKFVAEFSVENIEARQTFWNFIESIFERINLIFQYFATIFEW